MHLSRLNNHPLENRALAKSGLRRRAEGAGQDFADLLRQGSGSRPGRADALTNRPTPFDARIPSAGACTTPASAPRQGDFPGFTNWFQKIAIGGLGAFTWTYSFSATAEAAQEALRLVRQYVPDARIEAYIYAGQIGPTPSHAIVLPNGERMNAGLLLDSYYHQGSGADANSETMLRAEIESLTGSRPIESART